MPDRIGKLEPRFSVLLNPHAGTRLSRCPHCGKLTYPRKFALFIHVDGCGPFVQGKTCKFCSKCAMVIIQQDDLETELAIASMRVNPGMAGKEYVLLGIVEIRHFKEGLETPASVVETLEHVSDFKRYYGLGFQPGGWYAAGAKPRILPPSRPQVIPTKVPPA